MRHPGRAWMMVLLAALVPAAGIADTRWEIGPKVDARVPAGQLSIVGGFTAPEGVRFVVNNLEITMPIEVVLVADNSAQPLAIKIFKDAPEQPLLEGTTGTDGTQIFKFRTSESVQFLVSGPTGSRYQLMTWVGPKVVLPAPPSFVPASGTPLPFLAGTEGGTGSGAGTDKPAITTSWWIPLLLAMILVALVGIIVLLFRGQRKGAGAAVLLIALMVPRAWTEGRKPPSIGDTEPHSISPAEVKEQISERIKALREALEKLEAAGIKAEPKEFKLGESGGGGEAKFNPMEAAGSAVTQLKLIMAFMEEFGLIDPREAAVQPNYNPPGQPLLPSRCYRNPQCSKCFTDADQKLQKARTLLEDQYAIYKKTELQAGRIIELADAAAGLSPYAKLLWTVQKAGPNEPMNQAREKFYATYDSNLGKLINMTNDALIAIGNCERQNFNDPDWYNRYGMPYYNFMRERYTRK